MAPTRILVTSSPFAPPRGNNKAPQHTNDFNTNQPSPMGRAFDVKGTYHLPHTCSLFPIMVSLLCAGATVICLTSGTEHVVNIKDKWTATKYGTKALLVPDTNDAEEQLHIAAVNKTYEVCVFLSEHGEISQSSLQSHPPLTMSNT